MQDVIGVNITCLFDSLFYGLEDANNPVFKCVVVRDCLRVMLCKYCILFFE